MKRKFLTFWGRGVPIIFLGLGSLYFLSQCCKDDPKPEDPCQNVQRFTADFVVGEKVADTFYIGDTLASGTAFFQAKQDYKSYWWKVGDDDRIRTTKSFGINFNDAFIGSSFNITLIAQASDDQTRCFSGPTTDTIVKSFVVGCYKSSQKFYNFSMQYGCIGFWEGAYTDSPDQKFVVKIVYYDTDANVVQGQLYGNRIFNLPEGCGGPRDTEGCSNGDTTRTNAAIEMLAGSNWFCSYYLTDRGKCCPPAYYSGRLDPNDRNKITIYYKNATSYKIWKGKRI